MLLPKYSSDSTVTMQGSAMLLMMTVLVMVLSAILLDGLAVDRVRSQASLNNVDRLGQAQEALIAFAMTHPEMLGILPCPDMDFSGEGRSDVPCHFEGDMAVGWLPWRDLGIVPLHTREGLPFWYAVARGALSSELSEKQRVLTLRLEGVSQSVLDQSVALVITPGKKRGHAPTAFSRAMLQDASLLPITHADLTVTSGDGK